MAKYCNGNMKMSLTLGASSDGHDIDHSEEANLQ